MDKTAFGHCYIVLHGHKFGHMIAWLCCFWCEMTKRPRPKSYIQLGNMSHFSPLHIFTITQGTDSSESAVSTSASSSATSSSDVSDPTSSVPISLLTETHQPALWYKSSKKLKPKKMAELTPKDMERKWIISMLLKFY